MSTLSIRLPDDLLASVDKQARELKIPLAEYVRRALEAMQAMTEAERRRRRIMEASRKVRKDSMRINAEFEALDDEFDA